MIYADDNFDLIFSLVGRQLAAARLLAAKLWRRNKEILSPYIAHNEYSNDDGDDGGDDGGDDDDDDDGDDGPKSAFSNFVPYHQ